MVSQVQLLLFALVIKLSPVIGYICSNDENSLRDIDRDAFENHGCFCGTSTVSTGETDLSATFSEAFEGCHETNIDKTIECAFTESTADLLNRTPLSEIPVVQNGAKVYGEVTCLLLSGNQISNITFEQMRQFPKLRRIFLEKNSLKSIQHNAFANNPDLIELNFAFNDIQMMPNITGLSKLEEINFAYNNIKIIPDISGLTSLKKIDLQHNQIEELEQAHFRRLENVDTMYLNDNKIRVLKNFIFQDMSNLFTLTLGHNKIHQVEERAFNGTKLNNLTLNDNEFSKLPTNDLKNLEYVNVKGVKTLYDFPRAYNDEEEPTFPFLKKLTLEYQTHCCWYKDYHRYKPFQQITIDIHSKRRRQSTGMKFMETNESVDCTPQPDAFHPCYDIMDFLVLRIAIWLTIAVAVCGNILVIVVLIFSMITRGATVPQVLITNLAAADFCLAVYLIFIAAADLDTAGNYQNEAFNWELSVACKTAGFFAVFSSVASVCLLALITFERMTTIAFSYTGKRFMTIPKTVVALIVVWLIAFIFGILPAVDVSDYGKVCICLPFETNTSKDKGYIISLLIFTGIICFFILVCYVILFIRVKKTTSSLSGRQELRIAFKMSVLVLTDFAIWTPIAVIGLTGVLLGKSLIDVQESKYLMIFIFPINSWVNPILYSILQTAFRNQICDMFARCGLCKEYHQRRKARAQGVTRDRSSSTSDGRKFRISSITSTATLTSFLNLFNKRGSVTSIGSNDVAQPSNLTKRKHRSHSSTSSDQPSIKEGKFLKPIHESSIHVHEMQRFTAKAEADTVFYGETTHPASTAKLLSTHNKDSSVVLGEDSCDSGIAHSDQDNGITSNGLPQKMSNDQPLMFNVSFSPNNVEEESTEC